MARDYKAEYAARKARMQRLGRKRDYKSEYQRQKTRAQMGGFSSVRSMKKARPRARQVRVKRFVIDRDTQSIAWSVQHSHQKATEYDDKWSDEHKNEFYRLFVADHRTTTKEGVARYLRRWFPELETPEWEQLYDDNN